jgi:hypothetical protein
MSSSSNDNLPEQYYFNGPQEFRDVSDLIEYKKRKSIYGLRNRQDLIQRPILQSLQNRISYQFSRFNCDATLCAIRGAFPTNSRLTMDTPI